MSSYRLTTVCSDTNPGIKKEILSEIEKRDESFDYYSILFKDETIENNRTVIYRWCIIPKDYHIFNVRKYPMVQTVGKRGKKKGNIIGWQSKYFNITFSMSSQLWFHFNFKDIKRYVIAEVEIDRRTTPELSYGDIYRIFHENTV